ncbi:MAG: right-handed parallel beta-helix repeat-containing protein [Candidatus Cryptobacteroides sp.]
MKKLFAVLTLGLAMLPMSCVKEEAKGPEPEKPVTGITFKAVMEDTASRATLDEATGKVAWAVGDAVKFVWETDGMDGVGYAESASLTAVNEDGSADFTAAVPEAFRMTEEEYINAGGKSLHLYAAYPAGIDIDYSNASDFVITVPAEQDGTFASASVALAKWNKTKPDAPLAFRNLCGLLQVEIADASARKLVITSSTDIAGKASITFPATGGPAVKAMKEGFKSITVKLNGEGTYYVAVYPGNIEDVYVEVFDADGKLIGDRVADNAIPVARKQVRKLGTIGTGFADRFYVKEGGSGDKSGSNWDNAADISGLKTQLAKAETKKVYIAAGTYSTKEAGELSIKGGNYSIYGGYSADATGYAINNRDMNANPVIFDGGHTESENGVRIMVINPGTVLVEGVTFRNAYSTNTSGSAIVAAGGAKTTFRHCTVSNNTFKAASAASASGVIRISGTSDNTFEDCTFEGNSTNAQGGVIYQYANAKLNLKDCAFYSNTAGHYGGVIYTIGEAVIDGCTFGTQEKGNSTTSRGGVITMSSGSKLTIKDSRFAYNSGAIGGAVYVDKITNDAALTVTNSLFSNNTAANASNGGGAVGISGDSKEYTGMLEFRNVLFDANRTPSCGGAVWANGANVSFTDCSFTSQMPLRQPRRQRMALAVVRCTALRVLRPRFSLTAVSLQTIL